MPSSPVADRSQGRQLFHSVGSKGNATHIGGKGSSRPSLPPLLGVPERPVGPSSPAQQAHDDLALIHVHSWTTNLGNHALPGKPVSIIGLAELQRSPPKKLDTAAARDEELAVMAAFPDDSDAGSDAEMDDESDRGSDDEGVAALCGGCDDDDDLDPELGDCVWDPELGEWIPKLDENSDSGSEPDDDGLYQFRFQPMNSSHESRSGKAKEQTTKGKGVREPEHQTKESTSGAHRESSKGKKEGRGAQGQEREQDTFTETKRAAEHKRQAQTCFSEFTCNCAFAKGRNSDSCLRTFSPETLLRLHNEVYEVVGKSLKKQKAQVLKVAAGRQGKGTEGDGHEEPRVRLEDVSLRLHEKLWELKEPRFPNEPKRVDSYGRKFRVKKYHIDNVPVCAAGWKKAMGGSDRRHRDLLKLLVRGQAPAATANGKQASQLLHLLKDVRDASGKRLSRARDFAADWWTKLLMLMEYQPTEETIVIRGPSYDYYHEHVYKPAAKRCGLILSRKTWMDCLSEALARIARLLPGCDPAKLRASRCARHANFPKCTTCQERDKAWRDAVKDISATPEYIQEKFEAILEHVKQWSGDRAAALAIRRSLFLPSSTALYQADDKCGSFWQAIPVDPTGRHNKGTASKIFHFSVQSNIVCGEGGVNRFAVLPKHVSDGSNFGLTNLILTIYSAYKSGRMGPHVKTLYRHTDGGPDNVSWMTHIVHWLLVYVGVFDEIIWFRFDPG